MQQREVVCRYPAGQTLSVSRCCAVTPITGS